MGAGHVERDFVDGVRHLPGEAGAGRAELYLSRATVHAQAKAIGQHRRPRAVGDAQRNFVLGAGDEKTDLGGF